jgi:hypothetical protein
VLHPSVEGRFKGATLRTNKWGLHDKDYEKTPPPGCLRIAVLGASHAMGSGVAREDTFEAVIERRLNRERPGRCYEVLNFAVYGYGALLQIEVLETRALEFHPDVILYVGHPEDTLRVVRFLTARVIAGERLPFDDLGAIVGQAGVTSDMPDRIVAQRLEPFGGEILTTLYRRMARVTASRGLCAGFVFMPMIPDMTYATDVAREKRLPQEAGFDLLDLTGVYDVPNRNALWVAEWDAHPNAKGHALVADRLYSLLTANGGLLDPSRPCGAPLAMSSRKP